MGGVGESMDYGVPGSAYWRVKCPLSVQVKYWELQAKIWEEIAGRRLREIEESTAKLRETHAAAKPDPTP